MVTRINSVTIKCDHCDAYFVATSFLRHETTTTNDWIYEQRAKCPDCWEMTDCTRENTSFLLDENG